MTLYVCWGLFATPGSGHPCRNAFLALQAAGFEPTVVRSRGWGLLPSWLNRSVGRRRAQELTGSSWLPLLETEDGQVVQGTSAIVEWAKAAAHTNRAEPTGSR